MDAYTSVYMDASIHIKVMVGMNVERDTDVDAGEDRASPQTRRQTRQTTEHVVPFTILSEDDYVKCSRPKRAMYKKGIQKGKGYEISAW